MNVRHAIIHRIAVQAGPREPDPGETPLSQAEVHVGYRLGIFGARTVTQRMSAEVVSFPARASAFARQEAQR